MNDNLNKFIRKHLLDLVPYESARNIMNESQPTDINLDANENPYSISGDFSYMNRYPEPQPQKLILEYAAYNQDKINKDNILVTRGADEGIEIIIKSFCEPQIDKVMTFPPTYGMYEVSSKLNNVEVIKIPLDKNFEINEELLFKHNEVPKLIFICNPNNPTGNLISRKTIEKIISHFNDSLIVVDEAYIDFNFKNTSVDLIKKYNNLIILRTLSKAFSLAGVRCGFIISNLQMINFLKKVIAPYPIPQPVSQIALNALSNYKTNNYNQNLILLEKNKKFIFESLASHDEIVCYQSDTNFILFKSKNAKEIYKHMVANKIITRLIKHYSDYLRVTVGSEHECKSFVHNMKIFLEKLKNEN